MAEIQLQRIRSIYGDIAGILSQIPLATDKFAVVFHQTGDQYNTSADELTSVSETDYSRYKLTNADLYSESAYVLSIVRARIGALVRRLEEEYRLGASTAAIQSTPVVVTINQNQQLSLSVTPIQQIIDSTEDEEVRKELEQLKQAVKTGVDQKTASRILSSIQAKSWEVFMKVLPFALEHWGHLPK